MEPADLDERDRAGGPTRDPNARPRPRCAHGNGNEHSANGMAAGIGAVEARDAERRPGERGLRDDLGHVAEHVRSRERDRGSPWEAEGGDRTIAAAGVNDAGSVSSSATM